ncbi:MAG: TonB family protein [Azonexus sp.]|jgi:protein TonB|uniref:energy transducer TonB n=1 Tax=Azonexus sp. TaxID=1872668 RepID=UPI0028337E3B|nr:TonB family protein [Azonexus sp.]MDR0776302.1 TonB family protein [Azonexus sp.]
MSKRCLDRPTELPEWRRSGPFFLIAAALHLVVLAWPRTPAVAATPLPLQVQLIEVQQSMPELQPVSAPPPAPTKPATEPPVRQKKRPVLAMSPEQQPPTLATPLVAAPPEIVAEPAQAAPTTAVATAPAAGLVLIAARYNAAYLNNPEPKYPPLSRRFGEEGKVLLRVQVTTDGRASAVELEKSSNYTRLDEAARQAVASWRFVPARRGDEAVEASVIVPIVFRLDS